MYSSTHRLTCAQTRTQTCTQVTWEERWHALLSELEVDVARRCVTLRAEAERLAGSAGPAAEPEGEGSSGGGDAAGFGARSRQKGGGAEQRRSIIARWVTGQEYRRAYALDL